MIFSVIVPTYNRKNILPRSLEALNALGFPREEFEVIVVDNGSKDGTRAYLETLGFENFKFFYQEKNTGPAAARNLGSKNSRALYLAFTDDDCLVPADWLRKLKEGFERWPQAAAVGGYLEAPKDLLASNVIAQLESFETREVYKAKDREYLGGFESPAGGTNNVAYRRDVFEKLFGFDESFPVPAGEDADLKLRTVKAGYLIGYRPLKVIHLDPYTFGSFLRRSFVAGIGSSYFEKKHYRRADSFLSLTAKVLILLMRVFVLSIGRLERGPAGPTRKLRVLRLVKEILMNFGRMRYLLG